jgi:hypothetical protein
MHLFYEFEELSNQRFELETNILACPPNERSGWVIRQPLTHPRP